MSTKQPRFATLLTTALATAATAATAVLVAGAAGAVAGCERSQPGPTSPADDTDRPDDPTPGADEDVQIQTVPVSGTVFMLIGKGGNIGVSAGPDGILIIDDQFAPLAPKIKAAYEALPHEGALRYVLNTHYHGDHTGGNEVFGAEPGAAIVAHDNVRVRLADEGMSPAALPQLTFDQTLTVHFNGETIRAVHFAGGHTDGDSVIFFESANAVHMGDHFFNGRFPYVDLGAGGSPRRMRDNVAKVIEMIKPDTRIIPGHGPLAGIDDLRAYHAMLVETIAMVEKKVKAGAKLPAIKKQGVPAKYKGWGSGFISDDKWLETLYNDLTRAE